MAGNRYYISRLKPGEDRQGAWRVPDGEIEPIVIGGIVTSLGEHADITGNTVEDVIADVARRAALAESLASWAIADQRSVLLDRNVKVRLREESVILSLGSDSSKQVSVPARLVRRGHDLRLALPPGKEPVREPDPVLVKLVAHARAAQKMIKNGVSHPSVAHCGKRHLWQLLRVAWLAPDILAAIVEGRQPRQLTGRTLLRATNIPLDGAGQRRALGFA